MTPHTSCRFVVSCLAVLLGALPLDTSAQSLADVARASSAQRKDQPKAGKVYTNSNLRTDITPSVPVAPASTSTSDAAAATTVAAPADTGASAPVADASADRGKDEAQWRGRITAAREQLARSESFVTALQSQINALTTEFINRDDPVQQRGIEQKRLKALAELERVQREAEANRKAIAAVEDEARKAGVPAGWLR